MSEKERQRALRKLEDIKYYEPVEFRYRDGCQDLVYVEGVEEQDVGVIALIYSHKPPSADAEFVGSKVDPRDFLPRVPLHDLGYILLKETGRKISLMPFQKPVLETT